MGCKVAVKITNDKLVPPLLALYLTPFILVERSYFVFTSTSFKMFQVVRCHKVSFHLPLGTRLGLLSGTGYSTTNSSPNVDAAVPHSLTLPAETCHRKLCHWAESKSCFP